MDEVKLIFNDDCSPSIVVWTVSNFEKWALICTTLGFPFIKNFPSQEWNDTHPLKMTAGQVYECEKFHFLKSEC